MARKATSTKAKSQKADDFKSVAKRLECDEDQGRFEARLGRLVRAKVPPAKAQAHKKKAR